VVKARASSLALNLNGSPEPGDLPARDGELTNEGRVDVCVDSSSVAEPDITRRDVMKEGRVVVSVDSAS